MKKFFLSAATILAFAIYIVHQRIEEPEKQLIITTPINQPNSSQSNPGNENQSLSSGYKNGSYTGDTVDAYYGNVQIETKIQDGKITDINFLDYPRDRRHSININSQAMPLLKTEAIQAQSANVDTISGATMTSEAFKQSLQSALDKAKI